jgi:ABC-2 type transport system ATP-binding protein
MALHAASPANTPAIPPLDAEGICKSYGAHRVLQNVSLTLAQGEIFGLIGLNGVGKTTLIKLMLDLARADAGQVQIFGEPATQASARRNLSYLPEKFSPSRYLYGHEYLALSLAYYGKKFDHAQAEAMAEALDLAPAALSRKVGSYSKGMGQKLGLAGAFLLDQPLLILDEPMSGLDPSARIKLKTAMRNARAQGKTIFFSSHILADIDEVCDRIGVIHNAGLLYVGTPEAFKPAYGEATLENAFLKAISA